MDAFGKAALAATLAATDGWFVEEHVGYDGLLTIMATNDLNGLSYAFARAHEGIQITEMLDDVAAPRGIFPDVDAALGFVLRATPKA